MANDSRLREELQEIVHWLLAAGFCRLKATAAELAAAIRRIGTIENRLKAGDR